MTSAQPNPSEPLSTEQAADEEGPGDEENEESKSQLTGGMLIIGLIAVAIGIGCGLVMSSATFIK
jgi:hypothetical protein